ncbi:hypothetical protein [Mesorhizobium erdmanii]|uniref:hypothetical protein n=1 Tax=Mesorhizobium erdmanii TaxID=1777866 RepID=UPI0012B50DE5|nr:hypothetical protein [Mesorhizobium erdmanii]
MLKRVRRLDGVLVALFIVSAMFMLLGHEDPFARDALCGLTGFCPPSNHAAFWNKLAYDIGTGSLVSLVFYGLLIRMPEGQKRRGIKRSLELHYRMFKKDSIAIFLGAADGSYSPDQVDKLLDQAVFRDYFKRDPLTRLSKWDDVLNNMTADNLRELLTAMEVFRDEISFVLSNTDIRSDDAFAFFKRLSSAIYFAKDAHLGYDSIKSLAGFYWAIFTGWDWATGYPKKDIVKEMVQAI